MKDFKLLLKLRLYNILGVNKYRFTKDKKARAKAMRNFLLFGLVFFAMVASFGIYLLMLAISLSSMGMIDLLVPTSMVAASLFTLVTTIFKAPTELFGGKDDDVIMALPISTRAVVLSKIAGVYGAELIYSFLIMLPATIIYGVFASPPIMFYVASFIAFFALPVIPLVLSSTIGTLIARIGSRFKQKNLFSIVFGMLALGIIMYGSFSFSSAMSQSGGFNIDGAALGNGVYAMYPPARLYKLAVADLDIVALVAFVGISGVLLAGFNEIVYRKYNRLKSFIAKNLTNKNYKLQATKSASPMMALFKKELRRYTSTPLYVMNTAFGFVLMLGGSVALLFFGKEEIATFLEMPGLSTILAAMLPMLLGLFVAMSCTTNAAISMEGKQMWLLLVLPVRVKDVLMAKALLFLAMAVPTIIVSCGLILLSLEFDIISALLLFLIPLASAVFMALVGLRLNIAYPKLDWTSEAQVVKQGTSLMLTMFLGMGIMFLGMGGIMMFPKYTTLVSLGFFLMLTISSGLLYKNLVSKKIEAKFRGLS